MKRVFMLLKCLYFCSVVSYAQSVAINSDNSQPNASAILDVKSTTKGLLIPRMTMAQKEAIAFPTKGLLIYQINESEGFYFFDGNAWQLLTKSIGAAGVGSWSLNGNAGADTTNFIGTTDNAPLIAKVNNTPVFTFSSKTSNTIIGYGAGKTNKALENTMIGAGAGAANTSSDNNTFIGAYAGAVNTTGTNNHFIGDRAGNANTSGTENFFEGFLAGRLNTTGSYNYFSGNYAGASNGAASNNYFSGYQAGYNNSGIANMFAGNKAGASNTNGNYNFFNGYEAGYSNTSGSYNHFSGRDAGYKNNGSYNFFEGDHAGYNNTSGTENMFIGLSAGNSNKTGSYNTFIGSEAGKANTASNNHFIGYESGYNNTSGSDNQFAGYMSGYYNKTGLQNLFIGNSAGYTNAAGSYNTFVGFHAGTLNTVSYNHFVGYGAGESNTTGMYNHFEGYNAGRANTTGTFNDFDGFKAGLDNQTGSYNQFTGVAAGYMNLSGSYNYFSGYEAGHQNINGNYNTMIGFRAGYNNPQGDGNVFLGYYAGYNELRSNRLYIANNGTDKPLIYGEFDSVRLQANGTLKVVKPAASSDVLLTLTESGNHYTKVVYNNSANTHYWDNQVIAGDVYDYNALFNFNYTNSFGTHQVMRLWGDGDVSVSGNLFENSDKRLKKNIVPVTNALSSLSKLKAYTYNWIDPSRSKTQQIGVIAQEVEQVFPQLVKEDDQGIKSVSYVNLVPVLLQAINEQQKEIDELKQMIGQKK